MRWLRDLMQDSLGSATPVGTLGALARRALGHPGWPAGSRPQARSLAALLSKLDRGLELDWLGDRPEVQQVLADVLGAPRSRIAEAVGGGLDRADADRRRVRFRDIPFASPFDLGGEPLPPGIPGKISRPAEWEAIWWVAPRGSGRSLAGAWLSARSLASFVSAPDWETARATLPDSGPVFVELWGSGKDGGVAPPRAGVCVAAPFRPNPEWENAWTIVESEPAAAWLEPLATWLARRLPRDGHFEPTSALEWLRRAEGEGLVDGLGSAIGLAGLLDEHGVEDVARLGIAGVVERFVRERLAKSGRTDGTDTAWLEKNGAKIVLGVAKRMLTSASVASDAWDAPRSESEWMSLVPEESRESVDTEWVRLSLSRAAGPSMVKDIDKALRDLPPGAFRVVRALSRAGLLREEGGAHGLVLAPCWLARFLHQKARQAIVQGSPAEWGEALLSRDAAWVARGVIARVLDGDSSVLEDVLDAENPREPAAIAALELAFRAAGIALLAGVDIPDDTRLALWDQQVACLVERRDGPHPRIGYSALACAPEPLLDVGIFRLAALAISEALPPSRGRAHPLLRPWTRPPERALLAPLFDSVWSAVSRFDWRENPWTTGAFDLADRFAIAVANPESDARRDGDLFAVEWPAELLRRASEGTLGWGAVRDAGKSAVSSALALGARRNVETRAFVRSLWLAWLTAPEFVTGDSPLSPTSRDAELLYSAAPPEALMVLFGRGLVSAREVPYSVFDTDQWHAVLHSNPDALRGAAMAFRAMPPEVARIALGRMTLGPEEGAAFWLRDPTMALDALADAIALDVGRALGLLAAAPSERSAPIIERLLDLRALVPEALRHDGLRAWLHDCVVRRADGFRTALTLLDHTS